LCPFLDGTEARSVKKRKIVHEEQRASVELQSSYGVFVETSESLRKVAQENSELKDHILQVMNENRNLQNTIINLKDKAAHFDKERATFFRDACALYKRGILELQLSVFIMNYDHEQLEENFFLCNSSIIPRHLMMQCITGATVHT
jgi:regulator of replication initiation timing